MKILAGYLLHRDGRSSCAGAKPAMTPRKTYWIELEQPAITSVSLKFFNSKEDSENLPHNVLKHKTIDLSFDDVASVSIYGQCFRILRTRQNLSGFDGMIEHVIDDFEPILPTCPLAIYWVKAIAATLSPNSGDTQSCVDGDHSNRPAATSTPRTNRILPNSSADSTLEKASISAVTNETESSQNTQRNTSSGILSISNDSEGSVDSALVMETIQAQKFEIARLENLLVSNSTTLSNGQHDSLLAGSLDNIGNLSQTEREIFRLQEMLIRSRENECSNNKGLELSVVEKYRWRQAFVQSVIGAMKVVVMENRCMEKLELGLASPELHANHVQELLIEAGLPSLKQLADDGRYIDEFGFIHQFHSSEPFAPDIVNFACGLLMDHYSAQTCSTPENETFWKIHIDMNKPLSESEIDSAVSNRRYIPERMRPEIWRLVLQQNVETVRSKHRTDYYSLLARSAGFFGDMEGDSSFLDSALTLITGTGFSTQNGASPMTEEPSLNDESSASNVVRRQILVDIRRTLPNNVHFGKEGRGLTSLYRVLVSFARHKPNLGYCQGINFIAAVLLLLLDNEEEVFWSLVVLTENDRFFGNRQFDSRLTGARADHKLIVRLLSKYVPKAYRHIERHGTDLSTCFIPWLMCGFYDCVPFRTLLRIWDYFFMAGYTVFYRVAIALMKLQEQSLLELSDPSLILKHIKQFPQLCHDYSHLLKIAFEDLHQNEPWPSWDELLNRRRRNIKIIEQQDITASLALRRRRAPTKIIDESKVADQSNNVAPTFVTIVESDRCPDVMSANSRLFVWVDDPVTTSSMLYLINSTSKTAPPTPQPQSELDDTYEVLSLSGAPISSSNLSTTNSTSQTSLNRHISSSESTVTAEAKLLTQLEGSLVLTFAQFRPNRALISTVQSTTLACLDLETGRILWSFTPSGVSDDDPFVTSVLDSEHDAIYAITLFGTIIMLPCSQLISIGSANENVFKQGLLVWASRIFCVSPVTCAALLKYTENDEAKTVLLLGAGSFIYRMVICENAQRSLENVVKVHIPLQRHSSDSENYDSSTSEMSMVRQITPIQNSSLNCDSDMLYWWALCEGSPCLLLYAMHKKDPLNCQILTTLSSVNYSLSGNSPTHKGSFFRTAKSPLQPNCIMVVPKALKKPSSCHLDDEVDDVKDFEAIPVSPVSSIDNSEELLVGWPNGTIFRWRVDLESISEALESTMHDHINSSSHSLSRLTFCDCGCIIQPSSSSFPCDPVPFSVKLNVSKGSPYNDQDGNNNLLDSMKKALVSTFLPSGIANSKSNSNSNVPRRKSSTLLSVSSRLVPSQGRRSSSKPFSGVPSKLSLSNIFINPNKNKTNEDKSEDSTMLESTVKDTSRANCNFRNHFSLVSMSHVFRNDCPVNWMATTQNHASGRLMWAFQLEWMANKENCSNQTQTVAVLGQVPSRPIFTTDDNSPSGSGKDFNNILSTERKYEPWKNVAVLMKSPCKN